MALSINTNIASLQAQNNLNKVNKSLQQNQERLASGLRINSAADDAAGMAISDRMTAQIRGLNQAVRNANDAISVTNTAEGALQETTDILQRMRELAVQSSNDSNTASDRSSIQKEVNQLKQEIDRIATNTDFNGTKLLDGTFTSKNFQVGNNADQTISLSVASAQGKDLGNYTVTSNNDTGKALSAATWDKIQATADGAGMGEVTTDTSYTGAMDAAVPTQNINVTLADGSTASYALTATTDNQDASLLAGKLNGEGWSGVTATADANSADFSMDLSGLDGTTNAQTVSFDIEAGTSETSISFTTGATSAAGVYSDLVSAINSSGGGDLSASTAAGGISISSASGQNIGFGNVQLGNTSGALSTVNATLGGTAITGGEYGVKVSTVTVELADGVSIASDAAQADNVFGVAKDAAAETGVGFTDVTGGNNVASQNMTVTGPEGSVPSIEIGEDSSAYGIANAVNDVSGETGVSASAQTTLTMSNLSSDGTITFNLYGSNEDSREIEATVTTSNLQPLVDKINDQTGATGVEAKLSSDGSSVTLSNSEGYDIKIEDFQHSSAAASSTQSMVVDGGTGTKVTLYDTDNTGSNGDNDSTVVGGTVTFQSTGEFSVRSDVAAASGGIFAGASNEAQVSGMDKLSSVDVSTYEGSQNAINTIDSALQQIGDIRSELGAKTNRFDSTINNLNNVVQNVTSARQQIRDADIAKEAAQMTQNNVRQQASASILTQANQTPQLALQLLGR